MRRAATSALLALLLGSAAAGLATPALAASDGSAGKCAALARRPFGEGVEILKAEHHGPQPATTTPGPGGGPQAALPPLCHVEGVVNRRKGAGGKEYGIRFAMNLPDDWSSRFLLQGGGGLNGSVPPPTGPVATDGRPAVTRGFAVISDDSGHEGAVFDATFQADQRAALDFAEASVRTTALLGKAIAVAYYGRPIAHSYMSGCSTGGREGMLAFQRYPELFDGVIVGAPAMRTGDSNLGAEYTQVLFNQAAPLGPDGKPVFSQAISAADRKTMLDGVLEQCDALDGLKDGMIENVGACHFQPARLQCKGAKQDGCLSEAQVRAIELGFAGPKDRAGYDIYAPVPFDTGTMALPLGYLPTGGPGPLGPASTATSIDLDARLHALRNNAGQRLTDTNYWTNLSTYLGRGGKILFFHGVSDFWFSPWATWDYYQRASEANGKAFSDASRFYMVPGMLHCAGGNSFDQFDLLTAMVDWVEQGKAPEAIKASRRGPDPDNRPLCPYPSYAAYTGGDARRMSGFACKRAP